MNKLGYLEVAKLGNFISEQLRKNGVQSHSNLIINVNKKDLHKIDEDFYYRMNKTDGEYIPADNEITAEFPNLSIHIKAEN